MNEIIEIPGRTVGSAPRRGEILETIGGDGAVHYRVRWEDGHETLFYPGAGATVHGDDRALATSPVGHLITALRAAGMPFELIPHRRTTSAVAEARALGVRPGAIGKTIVVRADGRRIRVVVPASRRLDVRKVAAVAGAHTDLLTETELSEEFAEFEVGAVPPFGNGDDCVYLDTTLADEPSVIVEAGSHEFSLRLAPRDLIVVANAQVADVSASEP